MRKIFCLATALATLAVLPASARTAHYYGSIAYSPETGAIGYSWDQRSKQAAIDVALDGCYQHADDCVTAISFWDGACGAVAVGRKGGWGASWGEDLHFASDAAIKACRQHDTGCAVKRYQCTTAP